MRVWWRKNIAFATLFLTIGSFLVGNAAGQPSDVEELPLVMTLAELEEEIVRREDDLRRYRERLEDLEARNDSIRRHLEAREAELQGEEARLRSKIVTLCRMSRGGYLQMLRGARTWAEMARRAQIARTVVDRDVEEIRSHQQQVDELRSQRQQLVQRLEVQRQLQARIERYRQELANERSRRLRAARFGSLPTTSVASPSDELDDEPMSLEL